ncbi:Protein-L-isoaspartate O-methyltransferase [Saezia sanguinis]|uniref:Protein-L-isoaspartate O-methyltransferase n=1 Tax=Saezia sanguinis TaxID=1965230 RepID=A0A433SDQ2_9BURK|nr:protein-L-isoaspartate(D-aspartate) O-methyltransferase [Saezia sanguinis]RUS66764.1 Protein-L-isoaspartate O-methyltransferase [Saezia sanguinis]
MSAADTPGTPKKKRFPVTLDLQAPVQPARPPGVKVGAKAGSAVRPSGPAGNVAGASARAGIAGNEDSLRIRMVQRLSQNGIRDERVLQAMAQVPRHYFVDTALVSQAYEDTSLPIGLGQTISKPSVVARMLELIMPKTGASLQRVLEIGTGGGYQAAVLSLLAKEVYSVERLKGLHERARVNLRPLRLGNVHLIYADGMLGFASGAPYDAIIAAAGGEDLPASWLEQLAVGGCLVAPIASGAGMQALVKVERTEQGWQKYVLEAVQFVPLKSGTS